MTQTLSPEMARPVPRARRSTLTLAVSDCRTLVGRNLVHLTRDLEQFIQTISLPIILLLMFRYLLGGAIKTGGQSYINYVIAGLIVISIGFNLTSTVVGVTDDLRNGIVERFRSMPILGPAVLIAHVVSAVLRSLVSATVLILAGLLVGFRPGGSVASWIAAFGVLLLFVTALSWIAVILGSAAKTVAGASGLGMILVFVPYASSALVPTSTMPSGLRAVIDNQPVTPVIDTLRALLTGTPVGHAGWLAVAWWTAILLVAVPFSIRQFRRGTAR